MVNWRDVSEKIKGNYWGIGAGDINGGGKIDLAVCTCQNGLEIMVRGRN